MFAPVTSNVTPLNTDLSPYNVTPLNTDLLSHGWAFGAAKLTCDSETKGHETEPAILQLLETAVEVPQGLLAHGGRGPQQLLQQRGRDGAVGDLHRRYGAGRAGLASPFLSLSIKVHGELSAVPGASRPASQPHMTLRRHIGLSVPAEQAATGIREVLA